MDIGKYLTNSWKLTLRNIGTILVASIVTCVLTCLTLGILGAPLFGGFFLMYLNASRGKAVKFPELFNCIGRTIPMGVAVLLVTILVAIGLVLLVVPGLLVMSWMMYVIPLMADRKMGIMEALKASKERVSKAGVWMNLLLCIVIWVIVGIGSAAWGVGGLLTTPIGIGMLAVAYRDVCR